MKKFISLFSVFLILFSLCACSANTDKDNNSPGNTSTNKNTPILDKMKSEYCFTTEYDVEDYCENAVIVSKTDGLLFGLLNDNGKEIIPLKYSFLQFINKDDYIRGICGNAYLLAKYEDTFVILDINGNELLSNKSGFVYVDCYLKTIKEKDDPFFAEESDGKYIFYNEKCEIIGHSSNTGVGGIENQKFISNSSYHALKTSSDPFIDVISDYNGNTIKELRLFSFVTCKDNKVIFYNCLENGEYMKFTIDENNTITELGLLSQDEGVIESQTLSRERDLGYNFKLYQSNGTYKLEDLNGNNLFEERYFKNLRIDGENDLIFLTNEDNGVCAIGKYSLKKYINYASLNWNENSLSLILDDVSYNVTAIHEGKEGIIIPIKSGNTTTIYYFK